VSGSAAVLSWKAPRPRAEERCATQRAGAGAEPTAFPAAQPGARSLPTARRFVLILLSTHLQAVTGLRAKSLCSLVSTDAFAGFGHWVQWEVRGTGGATCRGQPESLAPSHCSHRPSSCPGQRFLIYITSLALLAMLLVMHPRIPSAFLAARAHCWLMVNLSGEAREEAVKNTKNRGFSPFLPLPTAEADASHKA